MIATEVHTAQSNKRRGPPRLAIKTPSLVRAQRRHFALYSVLPMAGAILAGALAVWVPVTALDIAFFATLLFLTGLAMSAGYHRLFTHTSYSAARPVRVALAILASMAGQGPVISWVAIHRRHHERADRDGDMHSPNLHGRSFWSRIRGFVHAHYTWMLDHEYPNIAHYAKDLLADPAILRISRLYHVWIAIGVLLPGVIGGLVTGSWLGALTGSLWGGPVRMFVLGQLIASLNSVLHVAGKQAFRLADPADNSRNSWWMGVLIWGEGWHNNHHAFPYSAWFGLAWYRFDISYYFIKVLELVGLAFNVKIPTRKQMEAKSAFRPLEDSSTHTATPAG